MGRVQPKSTLPDTPFPYPTSFRSGRLGASSLVGIGIAGVVAVLVAMLAMAEGYRETLRKSGSEDTAIVMRGASAAEVMSTLDNASVKAIEQTPGVARDAQGRAIASAELVVAANLPVKEIGRAHV